MKMPTKSVTLGMAVMIGLSSISIHLTVAQAKLLQSSNGHSAQSQASAQKVSAPDAPGCSSPQWDLDTGNGVNLHCWNNVYVVSVDLRNPDIEVVPFENNRPDLLNSLGDANTIAVINGDYTNDGCVGTRCAQGMFYANGADKTSYDSHAGLCGSGLNRRVFALSSDGRPTIDWWYHLVDNPRSLCNTLTASGGGATQYRYQVISGGPQITFDGNFQWNCGYGTISSANSNCQASGSDVVINEEHFGASASTNDWWGRAQSVVGFTSDGNRLMFAVSQGGVSMRGVHDVLYATAQHHGQTLKAALKYDGGSKAGLYYRRNNAYSVNAGIQVANAWVVRRRTSQPPPPPPPSGWAYQLYSLGDYNGEKFESTQTVADFSSVGKNDWAESLKVNSGYGILACTDSNFGGQCARATGPAQFSDINALMQGLRHGLSSIRVCPGQCDEPAPPPSQSNCDGAAGVYLYENPNYTGRCSKFTADSPNPREWSVGNDTVSSIHIIGNYEATLYEHDEYSGASSTFIADDADVSNDAIGTDRASSLRMRARDPNATSNCDGGSGVYLYEQPNYTGRCSKFVTDSPNPREWHVGNDAASSIRIIGNYEATLYENDDYNGVSSLFTGDDADFGSDAIGHDHASSIRVRQAATGPTACDTGHFLAEYFNNRDLSGSPAFRRCEDSVNTNWEYGGPGSGVGVDDFSVRWSGTFSFATAGKYSFRTSTDDGVHLWLDGQPLIDQWRDMGTTEYAAERTLTAGVHQLRLEYYEHGGFASAQFSWQQQAAPPNVQDLDDGRVIGFDQSLDGSIGVAEDRDDYYFDGTANQVVTLRIDKLDGALDPFIELYNPDGSLLGSNDDGGGNLNSRLAIQLRQNGRHKIVARGYDAATGGYRIGLSRESVTDTDDGRWITFGQSLSGTIGTNSDTDTYYVSLAAGRTVSVRMNRVGTSLDPFLELYAPNGSQVAVNDDGGGSLNAWLVHQVVQGGTYRIVARGYNAASSGDYQLSVEPVLAQNLAQGRPASASSTEFSGVEPWKAVDGNGSTRWSSRFANEQWWVVDLGADRQFNQVVINWEAAYGRSFGIYVQSNSMCRSCWTNVYWTNSGSGGVTTINLPMQTARYMRFRGSIRATQWGFSFWEFGVYNTQTVFAPTVASDDLDKPVDQVLPIEPLPPAANGKQPLLLNEAGQEYEPLAAQEPITGDVAPAVIETRPVAFVDYVTVTTHSGVTKLNLIGTASADAGNGHYVIAYEWRSDRDGLLATTLTATVPITSLSAGLHVISFRVQDDLGLWSEAERVAWEKEADVPPHYKVFIPMMAR